MYKWSCETIGYIRLLIYLGFGSVALIVGVQGPPFARWLIFETFRKLAWNIIGLKCIIILI